MKKQIPKLFIALDQCMVWEAYSNMPIKLFIHNVEKNWYRELLVLHDGKKLEEAEELITLIQDEDLELPGLTDAVTKHIRVKKK